MSDKMREEIERLEATKRYVADNLVDAIWVLDVETMKYEYATPSIERLSGYTNDELKALTISQWLTPDSQEGPWEDLQRERQRFESSGQAAVKELELECIHKSGRTYWTEVRAKYRRDGDGKLKILGVSRDITERKIMEIKQQDLITELEETIAEKERLEKENDVLRGLLPICSGCRRIRDNQNRWWPLDAYVTKRTKTKFTHTVCPDCEEVIYEDM